MHRDRDSKRFESAAHRTIYTPRWLTRTLSVLVLSVVLSSAASIARAQDVGTEAAPTEPSDTTLASAEAVPQLTEMEYGKALSDGVAQARAGDLEAAWQTLQKAAQGRPNAARAFYLRGVVEVMQGHDVVAVESFRTAITHAQRTQDAWVTAQALFALSSQLERSPERMPEARALWLELASLGDAHRNLFDPTVARARVEAIDAYTMTAAQAGEVKTRIEARAEAASEKAGRR